MTHDARNSHPIFTDAFTNIDTTQVINDLNEKGFFAFPSAIRNDALNSIENDSTRTKLSLNENSIGGVYAEKQYYLTNLLSVSKTFYDFCTSRFVFDVCKKRLGNQFRLKALRYYETYSGHHMQWHTDNKTDKGFAHIPGIIFIFYISDVEDGEFQYVEGSHQWSGEKAYSDYSDEFIDAQYRPLIRSFKMPRGSLVIYDTYGIHRAKPVKKSGFVRKSVFFQVDSETSKSEPIIVNTEYIEEINEDVSMFLGFGKPSGYEVFPKTNLQTLRLSNALFVMSLKYFSYRIARNVYDLLPFKVKLFIKTTIRG